MLVIGRRYKKEKRFLRLRFCRYSFFALLGLVSSAVNAAEWSGNVSVELRSFAAAPNHAGQADEMQMSVSLQPEFYHEWDNGKRSFTFTPFFRKDSTDDEREYADIRELNWLMVNDDLEWRIGLGKVFWGVTESQHLVDIINQTDAIGNLDGEDKLGQPMIQLSWIQDWGSLHGFVLPGFRERSFPGVQGRLRSALPVATDRPLYQSADQEHHIDYALRLEMLVANADIGLSWFDGTSRDPVLVPDLANAVLRPRYDLIKQFGLDYQIILEAWTWKLEMIRRSTPSENYTAAVAGFEFSFYQIADSQTDVGVLAEYLYDDRGDSATTAFEDDLFLGARVVFNDVEDTEVLAGVTLDLDGAAQGFRLEASRRLGSAMKVTAEIQTFNHIEASDLLYALRDDDYLQAELAYYF